MSHRLRETHVIHLYRQGPTGETDRYGEPRVDYVDNYASIDVRFIDAGAGMQREATGERVETMPMVVGNRSLIDSGVHEGHRAALEGDTVIYNEEDPKTGDWYIVENMTVLGGRGRTARGAELELNQIHEG